MRSDLRCLVVFALVTGAGALFAPPCRRATPPRQRYRVFAFAQRDASGFTDARTLELEATVKDIREVILKKKNSLVQLVEAKEQAHIVLEITERKLVERQGQFSTSTTYSKDGSRASSTTQQTKEHDVVLKAVMRVGDYTNELAGQCNLGYLFGGAYRQAAKNLVGHSRAGSRTTTHACRRSDVRARRPPAAGCRSACQRPRSRRSPHSPVIGGTMDAPLLFRASSNGRMFGMLLLRSGSASAFVGDSELDCVMFGHALLWLRRHNPHAQAPVELTLVSDTAGAAGPYTAAPAP